jgi:hypothetical protein
VAPALGLGVLLIVSAASHASADPVFFASVFGGPQGGANPPATATGDGANVRIDLEHVPFGTIGSAFAIAGGGYVGVFASAGAVTGSTQGIITGASANFDLDDIVIAPAIGSDLAPISGTLNFTLSGDGIFQVAQLFDPLPPDGGGSFIVSTRAHFGINGSVSAPGYLRNFVSGLEGACVPVDFHGGLECGFASGGGVVLPDLIVGHFGVALDNLPVGVPLRVSLQLTTLVQAIAVVEPPLTAAANVRSSFADTLTFSRSGPVFTLPAGYTVNSVSGNIVDNSWSDPRNPATVPEPATLVMMLAGGAMVAVVRRRARARR